MNDISNFFQLKTIFMSQQSYKIIVTTHKNPDGDALGSSIAISRFLRKLGHQVSLVIPDAIPSFYKWMPDLDRAIIFDDDNALCFGLFSDADYLIATDLNSLSRNMSMSVSTNNIKAFRICIDHHLDPPQNEWNILISDNKVSSTSEIVYDLLTYMEPGLIDKQIAECIYTGIYTDTNKFFHCCNCPHPYEIMAELIKKGINVHEINNLIYNSYTYDRFRLLGYSIYEKLKFLENKGVAYIKLTQKELQEFNYHPGYTEGIVSMPLSIENVNISALISERKDRIKISLRSKAAYDVRYLAQRYFNGGGHKNASGADFYGSLDEAEKIFLKAVEEYF